MKKIIIVAICLLASQWTIGQNVIGAPKYYNDSTQHKSWHGYTAHKSYDYNPLCIEAQVLCGTYDLAWGGSITWMPEEIGFYGSYLHGINADWWSFGPSVRLTRNYSYTDVQLYGGIVLADFYSGLYPGGEVGLRFSRPNDDGMLSMCSASLGVKYVGGAGFLTMGISVPLLLFFVPHVIIF